MMEIINKKHEAINFNRRESQNSFVTLNSKGIYFSASACRKCNLKKDKYVHIINDGDRIYFYSNGDKDGFKLIERKNKNSLLIMDTALIKYILNKKPITLPCSFKLSLTAALMQGNRIVEIMFNKPISDTRE